MKTYSRKPKTFWKRFAYSIAITLIGGGVTLISVQALNIHIHLSQQDATVADSEINRIAELHPGDNVPQMFTGRVPLPPGYRPGQQVMFEIFDTVWQRYFYFPAVVKDGYAICEFSVGSPQDVGRVYKITGLIFPENAKVPIRVALDTSISGSTFFGPSFHKRL